MVRKGLVTDIKKNIPIIHSANGKDVNRAETELVEVKRTTLHPNLEWDERKNNGYEKE